MIRLFCPLHRLITVVTVISSLFVLSAEAQQTAAETNRYRLQGDQSRYQLQGRRSAPSATTYRRGTGSDFRPVQAAVERNKEGRAIRTQANRSGTRGNIAYASMLTSFQETRIPFSVSEHLAKAGIPLSSVGIYVQEISGSQSNLLAVNPTMPMNPASTMKLVTTYAAMEIMGGQYQWTTTVYRDGPVVNGTLEGNLIFKGTGDPKITAENFQVILQKLQESGIRHIAGDVILDRSQFHVPAGGSFDNNSTRAYNVDADPLMMGYKSIVIRLNGDPVAQQVAVSLLPHPKQIELVSDVQFDRTCGNWDKKIRQHLTKKPDGGYLLTITGRFSSECGERELPPIALLNMQQFFAGVFETEWTALGGTIGGRIREGVVPANAAPVVVHRSEPLENIVWHTNKSSNNMFAKQLYLSLGAKNTHAGGSPQKSFLAVKNWLTAKGLSFPELVMENGSGLSRIERISPQSLAQLLEKAAYSPVFDRYINSLPVVGIDGTMARRLRDRQVTGRAYIKTGTLRDVKAVAGYVQSHTKRDYVVVFMINHPNGPTPQGVAALDQLIEWVYLDGPTSEYPPL